ncbi:DMT family transporter [Salmonella enterica]|nr:DMT family transporter [Salmonella enterica]
MQQAIYLLLAFFAGAALPIQGSANAELSRILGNPVTASLISALVSITLMLLLSLFFRIPLPGAVLRAPWWAWLGGIMGVFFLVTSTFTVPVTGTANFLVTVITGQVIAALLIDKLGLLNVPVHPLSLSRIMGVIFVIAGAVMINYRR